MNTEGYLNLSKGKVWYRIAGQQGKMPLLILHGGPGYPSDYLWNHDLLANDRQVVYYDQLGCGRSDRVNDKSLWTVEYFVYELQEVRRALGLDEIQLLGHSWGTMLVADYMLTNPVGIKSIIFASPCLSAQRWQQTADKYLDELPEGKGEWIRKYVGSEYPAPEFKEAEKLYNSLHALRLNPQPELVKAAARGFGLDLYKYMWGPQEYQATGTLKNYDRSSDLQKIHLPTLFTCGAFDTADPASTEFYRSQIAGAQIHVFKNSSHMPHLEEEQEYMNVVQKFIADND